MEIFKCNGNCSGGEKIKSFEKVRYLGSRKKKKEKKEREKMDAKFLMYDESSSI